MKRTYHENHHQLESLLDPLAAAILATVLLLPYAMEVQSSAIDLTKLPIPLPLVFMLQIVQNAVLFAVAIFGGLFFAGRVGLENADP